MNKDPYLKLLEELFSDLTDTEIAFEPDPENREIDFEEDTSIEDLWAEIEYIEDSLSSYTGEIDKLNEVQEHQTCLLKEYNKGLKELSDELKKISEKQTEIIERLEKLENEKQPVTYPWYPPYQPYSPSTPYVPQYPLITWVNSGTGEDQTNSNKVSWICTGTDDDLSNAIAKFMTNIM